MCGGRLRAALLLWHAGFALAACLALSVAPNAIEIPSLWLSSVTLLTATSNTSVMYKPEHIVTVGATTYAIASQGACTFINNADMWVIKACTSKRRGHVWRISESGEHVD
jgi:hypothetical protein